MKADNSNVSNYGKTRKHSGLRRQVNKAVRRNVKEEIRIDDLEGVLSITDEEMKALVGIK
jgi:hypothetical protein